MQMEQLWGGAFFIGFIASAWQKLKSVGNRLISTVIINATLDNEVASAVSAHIWKSYKRSPIGDFYFSSLIVHVRPVKRIQCLGFEDIGTEPVVFWNKWRPILVSEGKSNGPVKRSKISFIRGTFKLDNLLVAALDEWNEKKFPDIEHKRTRYFVSRCSGRGSLKELQAQNKISASYDSDEAKKQLSNVPVDTGDTYDEKRVCDFRLLKWKPDDIGADIPLSKRALDALAFPPEVDKVIKEIKQWYDSEKWYEEKQIPWRRGLLLYGPPGTGKTSLTRALAQDFDLPVFVFDLASMSNKDLIKEWRNMQGHVPCIALIEDIDAVFDGRTNKLGDDGGGLSFDCLLNVLSGIEPAHGVFTVVTTNKVESLDAALGVPCKVGDKTFMSTRPGRLDRAVELGILTKECRIKLASRILSDYPELIDQMVTEGDGDTGAQFQERCSQIALEHYWTKNHPTEDKDILFIIGEIEKISSTGLEPLTDDVPVNEVTETVSCAL